jgi:WD40 repeat protein
MSEDEFYDAQETPFLSRGRSSILDNTDLLCSPIDRMLKSCAPASHFAINAFSGSQESINSVSSTDLEAVETPPDHSVPTAVKGKVCSEFGHLEQVQGLTLENHVCVAKISPDGRLIALGGEEGFMAVYSIAASLEPLKRTRVWTGHRDSVKDLAWSPASNQVLSASSDRSVMLWSIDHPSPLSVFPHPDLVSSVDFHPANSSFFVTGCVDKVLRLWSFPNSRAVFSNSFSDVITCCKFNPDGALLVVGFQHGLCEVFEGEVVHELRHIATLNCRNRRGLKSRGKRVTGLEFSGDQTLLVSTADSRMRLFSLSDYSMQQKYKGHSNETNLICGSFSNNLLHIISGSENGQVYIWNTHSNTPSLKVNSYESFRPSRARQVLCAGFWRETALRRLREAMFHQGFSVSHAIFSVDSVGELQVFFNQFKTAD